ncbi:MAG: class I SAM-dependent methyltransferase [Caulobacteraceae bacterium]
MSGAALLDGAYDAKAASYFANPRREWLEVMPANPGLAVLELGCGNGATGAAALAEGRCGVWVGIERQGLAASQAARVLSEVIAGDVDSLAIPYAEASFDLLIMGEVLEHLPDPEATLARLVRYVKPGGEVVASTPNIGHWRIVAGLIRGRFDYEAEGVMDRTHLKWFTPRSLRRAFEQAGLARVEVRALGWKGRSRAIAAALPFRQLLWRQIEARGVRSPAVVG